MGRSVQGTCLKTVIVLAIKKKKKKLASALTWRWFVVPKLIFDNSDKYNGRMTDYTL